MGKKRKTRKQKEKAASRRLAQAQKFQLVKRQIPEYQLPQTPGTTYKKRPEKSGFLGNYSFLVRDLGKTLLLASLILGSELVLYLFQR